MTYFGFLAVFLVLPIIALRLLTLRMARQGRAFPDALSSWAGPIVILTHSLIALIYTTPWDNYLVATRVWWYDPALVNGLVIGYVPIEEYTFFILQPILTGSWLLLLARMRPSLIAEPPEVTTGGQRFRAVASITLIALWIGSVIVLISGWQPGTYLSLLLAWALPPLILQVVFGGDILWRYRKLALIAIVPVTVYLAAADKLAIMSGTWTIAPDKSLGLNLFGRLPIEEVLFFLMTNILIGVGSTLMLARESKARLDRLRDLLRSGSRGRTAIRGDN